MWTLLRVRKFTRRLLALSVLSWCMAAVAPPGWAQQWGLDARPANPTCLAGDAPASGPATLKAVFPELTSIRPFDLHPTPGSTTEFHVIDRWGFLYSYLPGEQPRLVLDVSSVVGVNDLSNAYACDASGNCPGSEHWGLVSFAFHPDFATNNNRKWVFLLINGRQASDAYTTSYVIRYTLKADGSGFDPASKLTILQFPQRDGFLHHMGNITFGSDGFLYIGSGDNTPNGWNVTDVETPPSQNLGNWHGKILRIDVNNSTPAAPYDIPANPFVNVPGAAPEVFALGFRNPWRFSVDQSTGQLWVGDVGYAQWEEVDQVRAGGNYGWPIFEADICLEPGRINPDTGSACTTAPAATAPVASFNHNGLYMAIIGGHVYRGSAIPSLIGKYLFGLYMAGQSSQLYALDPATGNSTSVLIDGTAEISSWFTDSAGELYGVAPWERGIYKLVPGTSGGAQIPQLLSQTGCVDPANPKSVVGMIPYGVNSALWSDGAEKMRALALPDGKTITLLSPDGDFDFPNGTVLMKTFLFNKQPFETRLLKKHTDGTWIGYSYQWQGNDAMLVDANGLNAQLVNNQGQTITWHYPSRGECRACHTAAANYSLGLELGQQNGLFKYSNGRTANQVTTWDHIGMFSGPLPKTIPLIPNYADTTVQLGARASSYLHSNCSGCHRPGNNLSTPMDLRYGTSFANKKVCDATTTIDDLGIPDARLLYPGDPYKSLITQRMNRRGPYQMPLLGSNIVHAQGVGLIASAIRSTTTCP